MERTEELTRGLSCFRSLSRALDNQVGGARAKNDCYRISFAISITHGT